MTELAEKIKKWQDLCKLRELADDHTRCPECKGQLYFCDCVAWKASEILEEMTSAPAPVVWTNGKTFRKYIGQDKNKYTIHTAPSKGFKKYRAILIPEEETN